MDDDFDAIEALKAYKRDLEAFLLVEFPTLKPCKRFVMKSGVYGEFDYDPPKNSIPLKKP